MRIIAFIFSPLTTIVLLALIQSASANATSSIHQTKDLKSCLTQADLDSNHLSKDQTLYVFDIDNTVLKLKSHLGSVQWFRWQHKLILDQIPTDRIANNIDDLLTAQSWIYQISTAAMPEQTTRSQIAEIQSKGSRVMFHTSRSTDVRDITERDLKAAQLIPLTHTIGLDQGFPGTFTFSTAIPKQRPVSFQNGVYMSAGQNKGIWLEQLLQKVSFTPKHLVFVDDEVKNLNNVLGAFDGKISLTLCRYGYLDDEVESFEKSKKTIEIQQWKRLKDLQNELAIR